LNVDVDSENPDVDGQFVNEYAMTIGNNLYSEIMLALSVDNSQLLGVYYDEQRTEVVDTNVLVADGFQSFYVDIRK